MSDVLMVVVAYSNWDLTRSTLLCLRDQTIPVKVVLWDNTEDKDPKWAREAEKLSAIYHSSEQNILWTPAVNRAIEKFYDQEIFIGFMNNDVLLPPNAIENLTETAIRPEVGIVGPVGSRIGGLQDHAHHLDDYPKDSNECRATYITGVCCLLRKEVWDKVGPLDENLPLGADDHDYSIRLKHKGYHIMVRTDTYAEHADHASFSDPHGKEQWNLHGKSSWDRFNQKWDGYYATKEEALKCHWNSLFLEGWDRGTGWSEEVYKLKAEY